MEDKCNTKNGEAWEKLFNKYNIIDVINKKNSFEITSIKINEYREARLMTKFDHRKNLPQIFKDKDLSILPISRGSYIISRFETYKIIEDNCKEIVKTRLPYTFESIGFKSINNESAAINYAYISGILSDFIEDERIFPTISGRMGSGYFSFRINILGKDKDISINVNNAQIEIDGGFEGENSLTLIEAKNSLCNDFLIRQIYYPFRLWRSKISKKINNIFLIYSNGIYNLYKYDFKDDNYYNSLILTKHKQYSIEPVNISLKDIAKVLGEIEIEKEPEIPFPQADSFERIINLCELLNKNKELSRDEITSKYDFNVRQTGYYTDAGRYLGLISKNQEDGVIKYYLTTRGMDLFKLNLRERQLKFVEYILEHEVFNRIIAIYMKTSCKIDKDKIIEIMKESNLYGVSSETTIERRAQTVLSWINWIIYLTN